MARLKRKQKGSTFRRPRRRLNFENEKTHYGQECQRTDMSADDYNIAMNLFLQNLQEQVNNRKEVERSTILQAESALWLELRRCNGTIIRESMQKETKHKLCPISKNSLVFLFAG
ncbi:hypothetical protein ACJJTC_013234 [Scirpophaga incertulas]